MESTHCKTNTNDQNLPVRVLLENSCNTLALYSLLKASLRALISAYSL